MIELKGLYVIISANLLLKGDSMTAQDYGKIIVKRKWLALLVGLLFTVFWIGGLSGLSMNPDNRIFFSKDNPQLLALETLEKTYSRDDNVYLT